MSQFGTSQLSRPYGVGILIAGVDKDFGAQLYYVDPSGTKTKFLAKAIGSGQESAQDALKEQYSPSMSLEEAKTLALETLKQVMAERCTEHNYELAVIPLNVNE